MNQDDIIEKIKKCLRLARKAGTEGEKIAAEAAAERMAKANGISLDRVNPDGENVAGAKIEQDTKLWRARGIEIAYIVQIIRDHFGVVMLTNRWKRSPQCSFTFFGSSLNIDVAKYVFQILWRESDKAWTAARGEDRKLLLESAHMVGMRIPKGTRLCRLNKRCFMSGWFMQIDRKLKEHPLRNDIEVYQQEKAEAERKFQEYKDQHQGQVKTNHHTVKQNDKNALYAGYMAAAKVNLNRPCEGRETASPFALGVR